LKGWQAALLLLGVSFALYANALTGDYVFDDWTTFHNPRIRAKPLAELMHDYRPLRYLSYRLDAGILGDKPVAYHIFNTLYHGITAFVVFLLLRNLAGGGVALAGALLFVAHPVQTESVAYMSGRRDVLSTLLYLLGLLAWTRVRTSWLEFSPKRRARWLIPTLVLFALAFETKEMAITLPAVCFLYDVLIRPGRGSGRIRAAFLWPRFLARGRRILTPPIYGVGAAAAVAAILHVLQSGATHQGWWGGSVTSNFATSAGLVLHYLGLVVFPLHLLGDHSFDAYPLSSSFLEPKVLLSLAVIGAGIWVALRYRRRAPLVTFGLAWFFVTLLPVLQIKPFHELAADHFLYLPLVGFCLLGGLGFRWLRDRADPRVAWALLGAVLLAFSARTFVRNRDWKDSETFWSVTLEAAPRCARAEFNLGIVHARRAKDARNDEARAAEYNEAVLHMTRAVGIRPDYVAARVNLGRVFNLIGRKDEARQQWEEALRIAKPMAEPPVDPGRICMFLGRYEEAIEIYKGFHARGVHPVGSLRGMLMCHGALADIATREGRKDDALAHRRQALEAAELMLLETPNDVHLLSDAATLAEVTGNPGRAAELRARASRLGPPR